MILDRGQIRSAINKAILAWPVYRVGAAAGGKVFSLTDPLSTCLAKYPINTANVIGLPPHRVSQSRVIIIFDRVVFFSTSARYRDTSLSR